MRLGLREKVETGCEQELVAIRRALAAKADPIAPFAPGRLSMMIGWRAPGNIVLQGARDDIGPAACPEGNDDRDGLAG